MGLFDRFFGKKPEASAEAISEIVETLNGYVRFVMDGYGDNHFVGDSQSKQVLALYCFGGASALCIEKGLNQPQSHAVALAVFIQAFGYSPEEAAAKAQACISAAPDRSSHLYPIIHRGLDGFVHWRKNPDRKVVEDFASIMKQISKANQ